MECKDGPHEEDLLSALRFAMVTTFYPPYHFGGDATLVQRLSHALARRGHEVDVIHDADAHRTLSSIPEPAPGREPNGVTVHPMRSRMGALSCLATQQLGRPLVHGRAIRDIFATRRFDVVHYHNISLIGGPAILRYGNALKLYTTHEHWLVCPTHVLWRHDRELCTERQCLRCVLHYRRPPQLWRSTHMIENATGAVDQFIAPSRFTAAQHRRLGFMRDFEILPNFLPDTPMPTDAESVASNAPPYFLFAGRLERLKGLHDVMPHFGADAGAELWVAGTGSMESELRRQAHSLPKVKFLGQVSEKRLRSLYSGARALVLPSMCYEVFPMVLLEAFRDRLPVIARRLGPLPELLEAGGGILFENHDEFAHAIRTMTLDSDLRDEHARAGRKVFATRWTESVVLDRYFELILSIARRRGRMRVVDELQTA